jgi:hypothetical protein
MAGKPKFTVEQIVRAVRQNRGMLYLSAQSLGCSHQTILNYRHRHARVREAFAAARGEMLDVAELTLWKAINAGESWAVSYALTRLGKDRGYGDQVEVVIRKALEAAAGMSDEQIRERLSSLGVAGRGGLSGGEISGPFGNGNGQVGGLPGPAP